MIPLLNNQFMLLYRNCHRNVHRYTESYKCTVVVFTSVGFLASPFLHCMVLTKDNQRLFLRHT